MSAVGGKADIERFHSTFGKSRCYCFPLSAPPRELAFVCELRELPENSGQQDHGQQHQRIRPVRGFVTETQLLDNTVNSSGNKAPKHPERSEGQQCQRANPYRRAKYTQLFHPWKPPGTRRKDMLRPLLRAVNS